MLDHLHWPSAPIYAHPNGQHQEQWQLGRQHHQWERQEDWTSRAVGFTSGLSDDCLLEHPCSFSFDFIFFTQIVWIIFSTSCFLMYSVSVRTWHVRIIYVVWSLPCSCVIGMRDLSKSLKLCLVGFVLIDWSFWTSNEWFCYRVYTCYFHCLSF